MSFIRSLPIAAKNPFPLHEALRQEVSPDFLPASEVMAVVSPAEHSHLIQSNNNFF